MRRLALLLLLVGGCGAQQQPGAAIRQAEPPSGQSISVPTYVNLHFEPFTRANVIAIAQREWRAFGQNVDDDPPDTHSLPDEVRPDHQPGLWQRVGDIWFGGQDPGARAASFTGKYNENGTPYANGDYSHAWSAAFVSYVMRMAGAGDRFIYSPLHADYINGAAQGLAGLHAYPPEGVSLQPGDLICLGRGRSASLKFSDLPTGAFAGHCDIVADLKQGQAVVLGGNVDATVTMKHIPLTRDGRLAGPDGVVLDARYPWMAVLRVNYEG